MLEGARANEQLVGANEHYVRQVITLYLAYRSWRAGHAVKPWWMLELDGFILRSPEKKRWNPFGSSDGVFVFFERNTINTLSGGCVGHRFASYPPVIPWVEGDMSEFEAPKVKSTGLFYPRAVNHIFLHRDEVTQKR